MKIEIWNIWAEHKELSIGIKYTKAKDYCDYSINFDVLFFTINISWGEPT